MSETTTLSPPPAPSLSAPGAAVKKLTAACARHPKACLGIIIALAVVVVWQHVRAKGLHLRRRKTGAKTPAAAKVEAPAAAAPATDPETQDLISALTADA